MWVSEPNRECNNQHFQNIARLYSGTTFRDYGSKMEPSDEPHNSICTGSRNPQGGTRRVEEGNSPRPAWRGHKIAVGVGRVPDPQDPKPANRRGVRALRGRYPTRGRATPPRPPPRGRGLLRARR